MCAPISGAHFRTSNTIFSSFWIISKWTSTGIRRRCMSGRVQYAINLFRALCTCIFVCVLLTQYMFICCVCFFFRFPTLNMCISHYSLQPCTRRIKYLSVMSNERQQHHFIVRKSFDIQKHQTKHCLLARHLLLDINDRY